MMKSLRGRLFAGLTAIIVFAGALGASFAYKWAYGETIEMQDSVLIQIGAFVANATVRQTKPVQGVDADSEVSVVELGTESPGSREDRQLWTRQDGLLNVVYQGHAVRLLLRTRPDGSRFAVMQRAEIRTEIAGDMAVRTLLPIAALVPCLLVMTAFVIARSFGPMVRLAEDLNTRSADDVRALHAEGTPGEVQPFIEAINGLLGRMRAMMDQQRRFIADAAHELRTPITALSLQAENLDPLEMPSAARDRVNALKNGMQRMKRLLEQLLALARQEAGPAGHQERISLGAVAKGVVADLLPEAIARDVDLGFSLAEEVFVGAEPVAIVSLVRNLVENAVKFTLGGGKVDLGVYREGGSAVFQIEDTGPGIPPENLARIYEPFFRGREPQVDGSGLGLSIVKRVVDRCGGTTDIENIDGAGLRATVRLPATD